MASSVKMTVPSGAVPGGAAQYVEPFYGRRLAKLPGKLRRLGVLDLPRDIRLLDACCAKGETLRILQRSGFRQLSGADGVCHSEWRDQPQTQFVACDVRELPFTDRSFDAVISLHALHHMGSARGAQAFLSECHRVLRPGGRLYVVDFPASLQISVLFWMLRRRVGVVTPGLRNFAAILDDEWPYVSTYLGQWNQVRSAVRTGPFSVQRWWHDVFLFYLVLQRPSDSTPGQR